MAAGPKAAVSARSLPLAELPPAGADRVVAFCERFVVMPKGTGARERMVVRPWQRELIAGVFDAPRPRLAVWSLPRGQGKSTLCAALGLYGLHADGVEGAQVTVIAKDERQAGIIFRTAVRMTELSAPLSKRTQTYQDRLYVPRSGSSFLVLPAQPDRLEGLDPAPLAIIDEIGVVDRRAYEVIAAASGKRAVSTTLCIGTPAPDGSESVMFDLVRYGREHPDDSSFRLVEYAAPAGCAIDDETAWRLANPGLDDLVHRDAMRALLPPKLREATFRRARLGQWVEQVDDAWLPAGEWDACCTGQPISDGADVVLALDGSFSQDCTAIVAATISPRPHVDVAALWEPPPSDREYRVPVADVEQAIRDACRRWAVREICADPYRWTRTLQALGAEGLPIVEFPQSPQRMTPATTSAYEGVVNRQVTHSGDARLARHIANAAVKDDSRGVRLAKAREKSTRRIDLAVCFVMAHSRAAHYASTKPKPRKAFVFR